VNLADLLSILSALRRATKAGQRAPHNPLLLLWLFARLHRDGNSATSYVEAEAPVSELINEFGPPVASLSAAGQRAAMPFVHL
jgi:putative restriction endonuclease